MDPAIQKMIDDAKAEGAATAKSNFLGLPAVSDSNQLGMTIDAPGQPGPDGKLPPIYRLGAENIPIMELWDPVKTFAFQSRLVAAGLLDEDFREGVWDTPSATAFSQVLGYANNSGNPDFDQVLEQFVNSAPMEVGPDGQPRRKARGRTNGSPLSVTLSNPDDLAATANEVAQKRLGRTFSDQEMQRFVASYQATERAGQTAEHANQATGSAGGTATKASSPDVAANKFAEEVDPVASQARNMLPLIDSINELLGPTAQPMQGSIDG